MLFKPAILLRVESAIVFLAAIYLYRLSGEDWRLFLLLFLWPDLGMLGYLADPRVGAMTYNLVHVVTFPMALGVYAFATHRAAWLAFALIWLAHIELDRALGFGLKYPTFFKDTHLQRVSERS